MRHSAPSLAAIAAIVVASLIACDPCAGTPSCKQPPEVSYGGQFINHVTGSAVGGVAVMFVRETGPTLANGDTMRAVARSDGFFQLRSSAFNGGVVEGKLIVTPPPPYQSYTVSGLRLPTSEVRGNGTFGGRLVVDPYLMLVGEVHDRRTGAIIPDVAVSLRRVGGVSASPDSMSFVSDANGRFFAEPTVDQVGQLD